jgi:hypothetical protein
MAFGEMVVTIPYRWAVSLGRSSSEWRTEEQEGTGVRARTKNLLGWSLWLATLGCCAGGLLAAVLWIRPLTAGVLTGGAANALAFPLGYATIGLVLTLRRPANPIGWLFAAAGLVWALVIPFEPWLDMLLRDHRPLALAGQAVVVAREFSWAAAVALGITLPFLLLPDGRLRSRRWRLVVAGAVVGVAMLVVGGSLGSDQLTGGPVPIDNPFGLPGMAGTVAKVVAIIGLVLYAASLPAALVCVVLRFRAARGVERQQLRWVAVGAAVAVIVLLPLPGKGDLHVVVGTFGVLCVPVAVAVAVLRYRLWDLDRLVSRTVAYLLLTALLVLPYLLILPVATRLAGNAGSLAVAAATLAAAALFQPLRRRVQDLVDRRFNRRRYDAARTVDAFAVRLREQVDLDALNGELLAVVEQTVAPIQASLWLRPSASSRLPS